MKKAWILPAGLVVAGFLLAGCGSGSPRLSAEDKKLFENAAPEIKQLFATALSADQANHYLEACTNYQALLLQKLSVDQVIAMQTAMASLTQRIYDAAAKGNADAVAAADRLKANMVHQGR